MDLAYIEAQLVSNIGGIGSLCIGSEIISALSIGQPLAITMSFRSNIISYTIHYIQFLLAASIENAFVIEFSDLNHLGLWLDTGRGSFTGYSNNEIFTELHYHCFVIKSQDQVKVSDPWSLTHDSILN